MMLSRRDVKDARLAADRGGGVVDVAAHQRRGGAGCCLIIKRYCRIQGIHADGPDPEAVLRVPLETREPPRVATRWVRATRPHHDRTVRAYPEAPRPYVKMVSEFRHR